MDERDDDLGLSLSLRCPENLPRPLAMNLMQHPKLPSTNSFDQSDGNGEERWCWQRSCDKENGEARAREGEEEEGAWSPNSTVSSVSGKKNEREERKEEVERSWSSSGGGGQEVRKKLRLSKEQSTVLEDTFKLHNTLNPKQKVSLAKQLNLRPRQVEVWFQNRRARTKLKQTEVDCEYLRRCCENVKEENMRLQQEVNELRALKHPSQFYMHTNPPLPTICPSCQRVAASSSTPAPTDAATARRHHIPVPPHHHPPPSNTRPAPL